MNGSSAKVCVVCGEDCSGKPRTKDSHGYYYCTPCYQQRLEEVREGRAPSIKAPPRPAPTPMPAPAKQPMYEMPGEIDEPFAIDHDLIAQEAAAVPGAPMCPACSMPVQPGGVICLNCGCNLRSGGHVQTQMYRAPRERVIVWPIVVGVISIVFGVGGALLQVAQLALGGVGGASLTTGSGSPGAGVGGSIGAVIALLLAVWLTIAGVGIVMRRQTAVASIRKWAIVKIVLGCLALTCVGIGLFAASRASEQLASEWGDFDPSVLFGMLFAGVAWALAWPIFILIWFGRAKILDDINRW